MSLLLLKMSFVWCEVYILLIALKNLHPLVLAINAKLGSCFLSGMLPFSAVQKYRCAASLAQVTINLGAQLGEGQLGLNGLLNLVTMTGATNPLPNTPPVRCAPAASAVHGWVAQS